MVCKSPGFDLRVTMYESGTTPSAQGGGGGESPFSGEGGSGSEATAGCETTPGSETMLESETTAGSETTPGTMSPLPASWEASSTGSHCGGQTMGRLSSASLLAAQGFVVFGMKAAQKVAATLMRKSTRELEACFFACESRCERPSRMSFICAWLEFGVRRSRFG